MCVLARSRDVMPLQVGGGLQPAHGGVADRLLPRDIRGAVLSLSLSLSLFLSLSLSLSLSLCPSLPPSLPLSLTHTLSLSGDAELQAALRSHAPGAPRGVKEGAASKQGQASGACAVR